MQLGDKMVEKIIKEYLEQTDYGLKENANDRYSISGFKSNIVKKLLKDHSLDVAIAGEEHRKGLLHIHDLGGSLYAAYCCGHDLRELLMNGLGVNQGCTSAPPKHFQSACDLMFNYMQILSNEWEGAQAFSDVDILLAPYIKEDMDNGLIQSYHDVKQSVQSLVFGLNYESRQGGQAPFTNFTIRYKVPESMKEEPCLFAGKAQKYTYDELQDYVDIFNEAFFEVLFEGDGEGKPLTFPIPTLTVDSDAIFKDDNRVTKKFWKLVAKFGSPYFANYLGAGGNAEDAKSMCCRLRLDVDEVRQATGIWDLGVKTGSLGVCTINLNRIALEINDISRDCNYRKKLEDYLERLTDVSFLAAQQLIQRKDYVYKAFYDYGLMPYSRKYVERLETFFLTIGQVGAWEAYMNLFTETEINNHISYTSFCAIIMDEMHKNVDKIKEQFDWKLWNIEQTPAEGAGHRLAKLDKEYYPDAYVSGDEGGYYLTNSTHYPVYSDVDLREELNHTHIIDQKYTGGTLKNLYTNEAASVESVKSFIYNVLTNTRIPYIAYTPIFGVCEEHGIQYGNNEICNICGKDIDVYTRVVGYIRPTHKFNEGQSAQTRDRRYRNLD